MRYGNARLSRLTTERLPAAEAVSIDVETAGRHLELAPCAQLRVGASVRLRVPAGYRVNAIGAEGRRDQDRDLALSDFDARYSIDRGGRVYRLEIYRGRAFAGLATLRFDDDPTIPPSVHRPPFNLPLAAGTGRRPENL